MQFLKKRGIMKKAHILPLPLWFAKTQGDPAHKEGTATLASIQSTILSKVMKGVKPLITSMPLEQQRSGQNILSRVKSLPSHMKMEPEPDCPLPAEWMIAPGACKEKLFLYMHGGAYRTGDLAATRALASSLTDVTGINTLSFAYRLAPEHPYPAALQDAVAVYLWLTEEQGYLPQNIAFVGDSAGGGLIVATALLLHERDKPLPACLVCISPWADLTETSESHRKKQQLDPLVDTESLLQAALEYSGEESLFHPFISPAFADYNASFPPTLIHVGTREILYDDAIRLKRQMERGGVKVELEVFDGMWHVWHVFGLPESKKAFVHIRHFVRRYLQLPDDPPIT